MVAFVSFLFLLKPLLVISGSEYVLQKGQNVFTKTERICENSGFSMVKMTENREIGLILMARQQNFTSGTFWVNHRTEVPINNPVFPPFPVDALVDQLPNCVFAVYSPASVFLEWFSATCTDMSNITLTACWRWIEDTDNPPVNATLFTDPKTGVDAATHCETIGGELIVIHSAGAVHHYMRNTPWNSQNITKFWTGHTSNKYNGNSWNELQSFPVYPEDGHDPVIGVETDNELMWTFASVNDQYPYICQVILEGCFYEEFPGQGSVENIINERQGSVEYCKRECKIMQQSGTACGGFNYIIAENMCMFVVSTYQDGKTSMEQNRRTTLYHLNCILYPSVGDTFSNGDPDAQSDPWPDYFKSESDMSTIGPHQNRDDTIGKDSTATIKTESQIGSKCTCPCNQHYNQNSTDAQSGSAAGNTYLNKNNNQTNLTLEEKIAVIVKEIQIDKKKTTSYHRRKTSAPDTRPLSAGIGLTAAAILGGCVLAIVAMDAQRIGEGVHVFWNGLHRIFKF